MPDETKKPDEDIELLPSLSMEESSDEKVEALWRQLMVYKSFAENDLAEARARRARAEAAREEAELEAIRTTEAVCERMRAKTEKEHQEVRNLKAGATKAREDAEAEFRSAREAKAQADRDRDQIVAQAQKESQEVLDQACAEARQETTELRRQPFKEIKTILTRVENMNSAVNEELETQRILTNVAKLKVSPKWMLAELTGEAAQDGTETLNADESAAQDLEGEEPQATGVDASAESASKSARGRKASRNS